MPPLCGEQASAETAVSASNAPRPPNVPAGCRASYRMMPTLVDVREQRSRHTQGGLAFCRRLSSGLVFLGAATGRTCCSRGLLRPGIAAAAGWQGLRSGRRFVAAHEFERFAAHFLSGNSSSCLLASPAPSPPCGGAASAAAASEASRYARASDKNGGEAGAAAAAAGHRIVPSSSCSSKSPLPPLRTALARRRANTLSIPRGATCRLNWMRHQSCELSSTV